MTPWRGAVLRRSDKAGYLPIPQLKRKRIKVEANRQDEPYQTLNLCLWGWTGVVGARPRSARISRVRNASRLQ